MGQGCGYEAGLGLPTTSYSSAPLPSVIYFVIPNDTFPYPPSSDNHNLKLWLVVAAKTPKPKSTCSPDGPPPLILQTWVV